MGQLLTINEVANVLRKKCGDDATFLLSEVESLACTFNKSMPPGMYQRGRVYYARFWKNGRLIQKRLSASYDVACEALNDLRARADRTELGLPSNDFPWDDLREKFLEWAKVSVKKPNDYVRGIATFEDFRKVNSISKIDPAYVQEFREWRKGQFTPRTSSKTISARTINSEVMILKIMLNRAVEWNMISSNPISRLKPLDESNARKIRRELTDAEIQLIIKHLPPRLVVPIKLALVIGLRKSEIINLKFSHIDFERGTLATEGTEINSDRKTRQGYRKPRTIRLDEKTLGVLRSLQVESQSRQVVPGVTVPGRFTTEHVFVTSANTPLGNNLLRQFHDACKKSGIDDAGPGGSVDIQSLWETHKRIIAEQQLQVAELPSLDSAIASTVARKINNREAAIGKLQRLGTDLAETLTRIGQEA